MMRTVSCWEEVVGKLHSWLLTEDGVIINVSNSKYFLADFPEHLLQELTKCKGMTVGILKTDSGYALRAITARKRQRMLRTPPDHPFPHPISRPKNETDHLNRSLGSQGDGGREGGAL